MIPAAAVDLAIAVSSRVTTIACRTIASAIHPARGATPRENGSSAAMQTPAASDLQKAKPSGSTFVFFSTTPEMLHNTDAAMSIITPIARPLARVAVGDDDCLIERSVTRRALTRMF